MDLYLRSIQDQTCQVGLVEYIDRKRKYEVFMRECEAGIQVIDLKQKKVTKTMDIYMYLQDNDLLSKHAQTLADLGKISLHMQSVLIATFRNAKKNVIGLIEHFDTPWFHKTYMEPTPGRDAMETTKIWQTKIDEEIFRILDNTTRTIAQIKEKAPVNAENFTNKTQSSKRNRRT